MKLAEALILRSDLNKKLQSLKERITNNAVVQEGEPPHEDPEELFKEACATAKTLREIVEKIDNANHSAKLSDGRTINQALAVREQLAHEHAMVRSALDGAATGPERYSAAEIKWVATISVKQHQKKLDDYAKKIRDLNILIQETNWRHEIN